MFPEYNFHTHLAHTDTRRHTTHTHKHTEIHALHYYFNESTETKKIIAPFLRNIFKVAI